MNMEFPVQARGKQIFDRNGHCIGEMCSPELARGISSVLNRFAEARECVLRTPARGKKYSGLPTDWSEYDHFR